MPREFTEEQQEVFDELLQQAREEFPDALDYNLQLLCTALTINGNLDSHLTPEEIAEARSQYDNTTTVFKTPA